MKTTYGEYTVAKITWHHHPYLNDENGAPLPIDLSTGPHWDVMVLLGDTYRHWVPPGCETWSADDDGIELRGDIKVLATPVLRESLPPREPQATRSFD